MTAPVSLPNREADQDAHTSSYVSSGSHLESSREPSRDAIPFHPLGVKPSGNGLTAASNLRDAIGDLIILPDDVILILLEYLEFSSLLSVGRTCKALYAFTRSEDLWKTLVVR
jgi:hypothetical protein